MKKLIFAVVVSAFLSASCASLNQAQLQQATQEALVATFISESQVVALCQKAVHQLDSENVAAPKSYQDRLSRLLSGVEEINGLKINYKVYTSEEINAFACGDGSIRVYSGLMDVMDDSELVAILGHECGHVAHKDTKRAMKKAYMSAAARDLLSAGNGTIATLARSEIGALGEAFICSQFSQQQEYGADDYGFKFAISLGYSPYSMCNALEQLVKLSGSVKASLVERMFSSHPDSAERAKRMREKADRYTAHNASK